MKQRALLIAGPTGSGKSTLALDLAKRFEGTIINADALQIYDHLQILTARPGPSALADAPHRLYGILPPAEICSAARYVRLAREEILNCLAQGRLPIVVGGTGLYLRGLSEGLADIPEIPGDVRDAARALMAQIGPERFHAELKLRDPVAASRIRPSDSQRLTRAFEVWSATGRSLFDFHGVPPGRSDLLWHKLALLPERAELYGRIEGRFLDMMEAGALEEAARVRGMDLDPLLPAAKALGLRPLISHLEGRISCDEAIALGQGETRRYAKRQLTWIKTQMISWKTIETKDSETTHDQIRTFLQDSGLTPRN
jgi:tRNA dimethylallyltransferase